MIKLTYILPTSILLLLLFSCQVKKDEKEAEPQEKHAVNTIADYLAHAKEGYPLEITKAYFTPDSIPDYFVADFGGISSGKFFDGETGKEIPTDHVHYPWSRPGVDLKYEILRLDCPDSNRILVAKGGSGGTAGRALSYEIYRFDEKKQIMKQIFAEDIYSAHNEEGNNVIDATNLIELNLDSCRTTIKVIEGRQKTGNYVLGEGIVPIKGGKLKEYKFNSITNSFDVVN
jgi:hypothetical protein